MIATTESSIDLSASEIFLGRNPVFDGSGKLAAYEMLFKSRESLGDDSVDDLAASTQVIVNSMSHFGLEGVLGSSDGFIHVTEKLLMSNTLELLPPKRITLEILQGLSLNDDLIDRIKTLKNMGFRIALECTSLDPQYESILPLVDFIKVDLATTSLENSFDVFSHVKQFTSATFWATNLKTADDLALCKAKGFRLFSGTYFSQPLVMRSKKPKALQISLMRIVGLLFKDAGITTLEPIFKLNPDLTLGLFRLVNSVGVAGHLQISSVRQALVTLGQKQLLQWMLLLIYTEAGNAAASELQRRVVNRARLIELLSQHEDITQPGLSDEAFVVGLLSLAHLVTGQTLAEVIKQIHLAEHLENALLHHEGILGQLLVLTDAIEAVDFMRMEASRSHLGISAQALTELQLQAIQWTNELDSQIGMAKH
ncbi:EAL and HDOD domain-containing protein [Polynucleobacter sp. AP-Feld-500C-C5]|uniref:EAL and HDOD domain-containing protein n=1 Tax=Polynucleobacter sp. AP-Feld-500C-C5 TaxID=2576924 RepID=UPI001C0ADAF8|nr:HDOD domain-containing protein [Polynucleobacter sp. AP-Feld-500C-C5]MBU3633177.1 HDOD domain-containing protein [Polynucleobacter sp. AP-Feld-500C-C5]